MNISTIISKISAKIRLSVGLIVFAMMTANPIYATITAGTYQIGPGQTYTTLTAAVAAYNAGISGGAVIFQLTSSYISTGETFPITITASTGASATNTLTIEPAASASPTISGANATAILKLAGASYVIINGAAGGTGTTQNLTIKNTNTTATSAFFIGSSSAGTVGTTNCTVENCIITAGAQTTAVSAIFGGAYTYALPTVANSNNTIQNNAISGAQNGAYVNGPATGNTGNIFTGNQITNCGYNGIETYDELNCQIISNTISFATTSNSSAISGINITGTAAGLIISGNNIGAINSGAAFGSYGIQLVSTSTTAMYVYNNYIWNCYATAGKAAVVNNGFGIFISSGTHYFIDDNSIYQGHSQTLATSTNACMYVASGVTNLTIEDNIFDDAETVGSSYGIYSAEAAAGYTLIDYNDYVGASGLGYLTSARTTVAAMGSGFGGNTHSISNTPVFTSPSTGNLAMTYGSDAAFVAGISISTPSITTDILGTTRASTPTIGAFEIVAVLNDASVTNITSTVTCPGSGAVSAVVTNNGANAISSVVVTAAGCSASPVTLNSGYLLSTPLAAGASVTVPLGNYTFVSGLNSITAATSSPNGTTDGNTSNDSKTVSIGAGLSGTYTVGAGGNYANLTAAIAAYNAAPICGPVIFQLTSTYTSSGETFPITINNNTGASATNTLTIEPASGVSPIISGNNASALIKINAAKYIIINGAAGGSGITPALTITNTNTALTASVIFLASSASAGSTNNLIENCILGGTSSTSIEAVICAGGATVNSAGLSANSNNIITNNTISNAGYGVILTAIAAGESGNIISNNTMSTFSFGGIYASGEISGSFFGNNISAVSSSAAGFNVGIELAGASTACNIYNNKIGGIANPNASLGGYEAGGIVLASSSSTSATSVYNNYIWNVTAYGDAGTANIIYNGNGIVVLQGGGYVIDYNSVYLSNNQPNAGSSAAIFVYGGGTPVPTGLTIKDNLFVNTETTGTAYGLYSNVASTAYTGIDYNDYYVGTGSNFFNNNGTNETSQSAITGGVGGAHSIVSLPAFTSTTNLNLSAGGAVVAGSPIAGITTDILGTTRNGTTPTIGAYEVVSVTNDAGVSAISSSATCPGSYPVTVTIKNYGTNNINSVSITAAGCSLSPLINYSGAGFPIAPGSTAVVPIGNYTFVSGPNNINASTSNPNSTTDGNTLNDSYTASLNAGLSGTFTVGAGGNFTTLTAAVAAYNAAPICGPVVFSLIQSTYSTSETFPIVINTNTGASATNTLTLKPASGINATITGSPLTALLELNGASYIIIDGSNTSGGTTQNLTFNNSSTTAAGANTDIWLASASAAIGATNNTVMNCTLTGYSNTLFGPGIYTGSNAGIYTSAAAAPNSNNTIQNNIFTSAQNGIEINGYTTSPYDQNWVITGNTFGSSTSANALGFEGIGVSNATNFSITNNIISGITVAAASGNYLDGIGIYGLINGGTISDNTITGIVSTSAVAHTGADAIVLAASTTASNINLYNNYISNIVAYGSPNVGAYYNGQGIDINGGGGYNIYYNTIYMSNSQTNTNSVSSAILIESLITTASSINIQDNIFVNTETVGTSKYGIYSGAAATVYASIDYNDYYGGTLGYLGAAKTTIAAWATATGKDAHSGNILPGFVSTTNLDLNNYNNFCLSAGTPIAGITTDIYGTTRVVPVIGADEFNYTFSSTTASDVCSGLPNTVTVTAPASTLAAGTNTYAVTYNLSGANTSTGDTAHMTYVAGTTNAGTFSIPTSLLASSGPTTVTITGLQLVAACGANLVAKVVPVTAVSADIATFNVQAAATASIPGSHTTAASPCSSVGSYTLGTPATVTNYSTYTWSTSGTGTLSNTGTLSPTYTFGTGETGNVTITLTANANAPCNPAVDYIVINIKPTPAATASNTGPYIPGQTISLSSGPSGQTSYSWSGPQSFTAGTQNASRTGATSLMSGNYVVTVTNSVGCSDTAITFVSVNSLGDYVWTGATNTSWTTVTNWSPTAPVGGPSGCTENVVIPNTVNDPVISSAISIGNVTINDNAQLTLNGNLSVCGFFAGGTVAPPVIVGSSHLIMIGTAAQAMSGFTSVNYLEINNSSVAGVNTSTTANVTVNKALILTSGNFTALNGSTVTLVSNSGGDAYLDNFTSSTAGSYIGNLAAQRYIGNAADGYRDLSSPVSSKVSDLNASYPVTGQDGVDCWYAYSPYPNLQYYNEQLVIPSASGNFFMHWMSYTSLSHTLPAMKGLSFRTYAGSPYTISFTGNPYSGPHSTTITHTTTVAPANDGWNLIGNPYPSPIQWTKVKAMNAAVSAGSYYVYHTTAEYAGNWGSFNGTTGVNGATDDIALGQGFFVQTANPSTSFVMDNTVRTTTAGTYQSSVHALDNEVRLMLSNGTNSDEIVTYTDADATDGYDAAIDAVKMPAGSAVSISYSLTNKDYAINAMSQLNVQTVLPLTIYVGDTGSYTLNATTLNTPGLVAYLRDAETGTLTGLGQNPVSLNLNGGQTYTNRYSVVFQAVNTTTGISSSTASNTQIYSYGNMVYVKRSNSTPATISITNLLGQEIRELNSNTQETSFEMPGVQPWYAIVKVTEGQKVTVAKLLISNK